MTTGSPEPTGPVPPHTGNPATAQVYPPPAPTCRWCGLPSAVNVSFRAITAFLVAWTVRTLPGPFCRSCGIATFRAATTLTLAGGWWGFPAFLINPIFVVMNLRALRSLQRLPHDKAVPPGPQLPVGKPVHRRPLAYIAVAPVAWILFAIAGLIVHLSTGHW
ncbi:hypothetical protein ACH4UR_25325 [Streptomyces lydicus]|uniref:hypothetical protein n=1 Tax=Streptomyces lydicus TaxID=47763 RepID=UPI0033EE44EF